MSVIFTEMVKEFSYPFTNISVYYVEGQFNPAGQINHVQTDKKKALRFKKKNSATRMMKIHIYMQSSMWHYLLTKTQNMAMNTLIFSFTFYFT